MRENLAQEELNERPTTTKAPASLMVFARMVCGISRWQALGNVPAAERELRTRLRDAQLTTHKTQAGLKHSLLMNAMAKIFVHPIGEDQDKIRVH